jgi:hypothetical protein
MASSTICSGAPTNGIGAVAAASARPNSRWPAADERSCGSAAPVRVGLPTRDLHDHAAPEGPVERAAAGAVLEHLAYGDVGPRGAEPGGDGVGAVAGEREVETRVALLAGEAVQAYARAGRETTGEGQKSHVLARLELIAVDDEAELSADDRVVVQRALRAGGAEGRAARALHPGRRRVDLRRCALQRRLGGGIRLLLARVVRPADFELRLWGRVRVGGLLHDVRQLVREQPPAGVRRRCILIPAEDDIVAIGECARAQAGRRRRRGRPVVDADSGEIESEPLPPKSLRRFGERRAAAAEALLDRRPRDRRGRRARRLALHRVNLSIRRPLCRCAEIAVPEIDGRLPLHRRRLRQLDEIAVPEIDGGFLLRHRPSRPLGGRPMHERVVTCADPRGAAALRAGGRPHRLAHRFGHRRRLRKRSHRQPITAYTTHRR